MEIKPSIKPGKGSKEYQDKVKHSVEGAPKGDEEGKMLGRWREEKGKQQECLRKAKESQRVRGER